MWMKSRKVVQWVVRSKTANDPLVELESLKDEPANAFNCSHLGLVLLGCFSFSIMLAKNSPFKYINGALGVLKLLKAALFVDCLPASQCQNKTDFSIRTFGISDFHWHILRPLSGCNLGRPSFSVPPH
jgi:hypothetical protein